MLKKFRHGAYQMALKGMFTLRPERIHGLMSRGLQQVAGSRAALSAMDGSLAVHDDALSQQIAGLTFPRPLGLAAGFDKDAKEVDAWGPLGFGFAEIGTVTALAQPGNPTPRLFRLPQDKAILNRMGFNNEGSRAAAMRLEKRSTDIPVGANLGKSKLVAAEIADRDYRESAKAIGGVADYLVINVSSPNTPGLRDLQAVESLRPIIRAVQEESARPLFVKIAPDLSDEDIDKVCDLAIEMGVTGLIATNTTISREGLKTPAHEVKAMGAGGISGAPVAARALEVLRRLADRADGKLVLIGVGGIDSPQAAWERIAAGASLIQGYTPFIYGGPDWIHEIHQGLSAQLKAHGLENISQAVGSGLPWVEAKN